MSTNKMIITVLGCGGFIGSHIVKRLLATGKYFIYGVDKSSTKIRQCLLDENIRYFKASAYNNPDVKKFINKSDAVISLAALCNPSLYNTVPVDVIESNFLKPVEIVDLCTNEGKWLIHFSTCEVYGKTIRSISNDQHADILFNEQDTPVIYGPVQAQRWSYACAKQLLERYIYAKRFQHGLDFTIIRPFNFIGPEMDFIPGIDGEGVPRVLACFMDSLMHKKKLSLVNGGSNQRVFTYIDDAVDAVELILNNKKKVTGSILNIGNPENEISIKVLAEKMIAIYREFSQNFDVDYPGYENVTSEEFYGVGYDDTDRRIPDITAICKLTGWYPKTDLNSALRKTIHSYICKYSNQTITKENTFGRIENIYCHSWV